MMKKKYLIILIVFIFSPKIFSLTTYKSKYFKVNISQNKRALINKLRVGSYNKKLYIAAFNLFDDIVNFKSKFFLLLKQISTHELFKRANNEYKKADAILKLLHKFLFKTYVEDDPLLSSTFKKGMFNCVSSTVIYNLVCNYFGIKTGAAVVPSHIFSVVYIDNIKYETETTVRYGFDAGKRRDVLNALKRITGFIRVPPSRGQRNYVNNFQALSYVFSQQGNVLGMAKEHKESLKYFIKSLLIFPKNKSGISGVQIAYYEIAKIVKKAGNYNKSIEMMHELAKIFPDDLYSRNAALVFYKNVIIDLLNQKKYLKAIKLTDKFKNSAFYKKINNRIIPEVYKDYADYLSKRNNFKKAINFLKNKSREYSILSEIIPNIYHNWIVFNINKNNYQKALKIVKSIKNKYSRFNRYIGDIYNTWVNRLIRNNNRNKAYNVVMEYYKENKNSAKAIDLLKRFLKYHISKSVMDGKIRYSERILKNNKNVFNGKEYKKLEERFYILASEYNLRLKNSDGAFYYFMLAYKKYSSGIKFKKLKKNFPERIVYIQKTLNNSVKSLEILDKLKKIFTPEYLSNAFSLAYYYYSLEKAKKGDYLEAYNLLKSAIKIKQREYYFKLFKAVIGNLVNKYLSSGKLDEALNISENSVVFSNNHELISDIYKKLVLYLADYYSTRNKEKAINILRKSLKHLRNDNDIILKIKNVKNGSN